MWQNLQYKIDLRKYCLLSIVFTFVQIMLITSGCHFEFDDLIKSSPIAKPIAFLPLLIFSLKSSCPGVLKNNLNCICKQISSFYDGNTEFYSRH